MKKKAVILLVILVLVILGLCYIINKIIENKKIYEIEDISEFKYFVMKDNEKYGVIDNSGKVIIEAIYDKIEIPNPSKDVFICYKNEKGSAYNSENQQLFGEYNAVVGIELKNVVSNVPYEKSVLKTEKNGKYGLIDFSGKKILETEYDNIEAADGLEGELKIQTNGKVGIASIKGTILVKPEYDTLDGDNYYSEDKKHGYIVGKQFEDGYKYGYINYKGKLQGKIEYNDIYRITDILTKDGVYLIAAKNGQYGVIRNKKIIIGNEYQSIEYEKADNVFVLQKNKNYGVSNINGEIIIPIENTNIQAKGEFIYVEKNNIREVYDPTGKKVNIDYNKTIMPTSNDNYKIQIITEENGNYYGVINKDEKQIISSEYLYIEYAFDNYFIVCGKNGKLGVLDSNQNIILELKYDLVQKIVGKNLIQTLYADTNTTELYSEKMNKICEMQNATLENQDEYIKIYSNKDMKYFNKNGEVVNNYNLFPNNKIFAACKDEKWGFIDSNNNTKVEFKYEFVTEINEYGYASIKKDGKWGAIDSTGKIIVEPNIELNEKQSKVDFIGEYIKVNNGFGSEYYMKRK